MKFQAKDTLAMSFENLSLFQGIPAKELSKIKKQVKLEVYAKGELIFTETDPCEKIFIVQTGRMKIFRHSAQGKEQILEVLEPGESCACNPGATKWSCSASGQAMSPLKVWAVPRSVYTQLLESNHLLAKKLNQILAKRLCRFCSLIESVSLDDPAQRIAKFLLDASDGHLDEQGVREVNVILTHEEIAQRLGLARETVSRHLSRLAQKKIIRTKSRRIQILAAERLLSS